MGSLGKPIESKISPISVIEQQTGSNYEKELSRGRGGRGAVVLLTSLHGVMVVVPMLVMTMVLPFLLLSLCFLQQLLHPLHSTRNHRLESSL